MTNECRYCGASFGDDDAYVRHLSTAHEAAELSRVDARLVEHVGNESGLAGGRSRVASFLGERGNRGSMRLPLRPAAIVELSALALLASVVVGLVLAFG